MKSLEKHHFAELKEITTPCHPCTKSCTGSKIIWCARKSTCLLKIWCYGLDADLLLHAGELWLAPSFPFSSWFSSWWLVLLLLVRDYSTLPSYSASRIQSMIYWFVFWCGGAVLENCGVLLMVHSSSSCWLDWLLWCCQQLTQSDDWAACVLLACVCHTALIWSTPGTWCVGLARYPDELYQKF
jgi:hypothetical protein